LSDILFCKNVIKFLISFFCSRTFCSYFLVREDFLLNVLLFLCKCEGPGPVWVQTLTRAPSPVTILFRPSYICKSPTKPGLYLCFGPTWVTAASSHSVVISPNQTWLLLCPEIFCRICKKTTVLKVTDE